MLHYLYSSIISRKFIIKILNKSIYCICIKTYTSVFHKMNNKDLQHYVAHGTSKNLTEISLP